MVEVRDSADGDTAVWVAALAWMYGMRADGFQGWAGAVMEKYAAMAGVAVCSLPILAAVYVASGTRGTRWRRFGNLIFAEEGRDPSACCSG